MENSTLTKRKGNYNGLPLLLAMIMALLTLLFWPQGGFADRSLRCNGKIISVGDFREDVERTCGEPYHVEKWEKGRKGSITQFYYNRKGQYLPRLFYGPIYMERWTYLRGSNRFIRYLTFRNGELLRIETGDRGGLEQD